MDSSGYKLEIKNLADFIDKCEEMLKESEGQPSKQKSILERLEKCKSRLHLLLAGATLEAIHVRADGINNKIDNLSSQVDDSALKMENIAKERKVSNFYITDYIINFRKISDEDLDFVVNSKVIKVTPIQIELLQAMSQKIVGDKLLSPHRQGWMHYEDIKHAVCRWNENTEDTQVRTQITQIRSKLDEMKLNKWLIQNDAGGYYRLSTHPDNIAME